MAGDAAEKKHAPSEKTLREAADRGQLPRSSELSAVVSVIAVTTALVYGGHYVSAPILNLAHVVLAPGGSPTMDLRDATELMRQIAVAVVFAASPPLLVAAAAGVIVTVAQTRFQIATKALEVRLDVLDPLPRFREIFFSRQTVVHLVKGLIHVFVLGAVTGYAIWEHVDELPRTAATPPAAQLELMIELGAALITRAVPVMAILAIIDYSYAYFSWYNDRKRTDQEVRDDAKDVEGDPMIRAQRRRKMREMVNRNAIRQLREATVIVTNPTHYAVGLRYRHGEDAAPVVVVKGADHLALKLRREAFKLGIPRVEDRMLARTLYAKVPRGHPIPGELYSAVAKLLALIYRRRKQTVSNKPIAPKAPARRKRAKAPAPPPAAGPYGAA